MGIEFKADSFNFEEEYAKIKKGIKKPNILICGATGVGKSSLVNDIFGKKVAEVGEGKPITKGIKRYDSDDLSVVLYDSEGYEIGEKNQEYFQEEIIGLIDKLKGQYKDDLHKHIHEVWYCISAANKRVTETDINTIKGIIEKKVPIAIAITQIDSVDEDELKAIIHVLNQEFYEISHFTICVTDDEEIREAIKPYNQRDELIKWSLEHLDEKLREGFVSSLTNSLDLIKDTVNKKIIPKYVLGATAVAVTPVPFADAAILTPIQITMAMHIMSVYGMDKLKGSINSVVSSVVISQVGKMLAKLLAANLLKFIPGIGSGAGAAVNAGVATTITTTLGYAISELCYRYSQARLNGENVDITDFFNSDELTKTIINLSHR